MIAAWPLFYSSGYSWQWVTETGETMLCVEKDDPREAPESGDKKPQPVKKNNVTYAFTRHRQCWWLFISRDNS